MHHIKTLFVALLLGAGFLAAVNVAAAESEPDGKEGFYIGDIKLNLTSFASGGIIVGQAGEFIGDYSNDVTDKFIYGAGLSAAFYPRAHLGLALNLQYGFKTIPITDGEMGRGWFYSASILANFRSESKSTSYARFDVGMVTGSYPDYDGSVDLELGTHPYIRFGLGVFSILGRKLNMRTELFYLTAFSDGYRIEQLGNFKIPFNASCFGVELGFGVPLMGR